ncbi:FGF [Epiphyas postvittana nucleopolyhedrovirus]|uniref:FGF n=2 Tax=Epiphyas postvittana nucleopolyhedrovirus TaxID=70600 RepID=Q91GM4_NPVEP|nr:FGF [Epiphyas postvittana nucleopolyhedrovirus]AAK85589.1 FGF [Epiphyas postvittana nucleopolyhedrovirus]
MHCLALVVAILACVCCAEKQLDHVTGTRHLVQVFVHNRYLAVRLNGTVEGTEDAFDVDTMLQRVSFRDGRILLRNAITCMHVCLDRCGVMYSTNAMSYDCFLKENYTENNYSVMYKIYKRKRTYVALNNRGRARRVQLPMRRTLRKMSQYALLLLKPVNYTVVVQCNKLKYITKHRQCRVK